MINLALLLSSFFLLLSISNDAHPHHHRTLVIAKKSTRQQSQLIPEEKPLDFEPTEQQRQNYWDQGGNDIVHEVWSVLRDFEPTWKDSVTNPATHQQRPSGLLQISWHYAKIIFRALFMNAPSSSANKQDGEEDDTTAQIKGDLKNGVETLQAAAAFDDADALFLLAEMHFYGNFSIPRNFHIAKKWYMRLADLDGNSTAQYMLGVLHATGIGGVQRDQGKAMMYHTFAAEQGEIRSEMTLAFRHHAGIATSRDCNKAVDYYKRVADKAMEYWRSGPPGGASFVRNAYRWVEVDGGIYGEGASVSSSGPNAPRDGLSFAHVDNVLEYLDVKEHQGDYNAVLNLGKYYYEAPRGYRRNYRKAQRQFMKVAKAYWGKDGKVNPKAPKGIERLAGKAAAYIGRMFLRGEGMEQNFEKAQTWLKRGVSNGDSFAQYHMGLMYRDGLGVPKDGVRAGTYLKAAAEQSLPLAQSALGVLFVDQGDIETAGRYFELAAGAGVMEAYYYLAEMTNQGVGPAERNCGLATVYYKVVAERAELLHSAFLEANSAYERGDFERAFIPTVMAAEQGYEYAQANAAFLLDKKTSVLSFSLPGIPFFSSDKPAASRSKLLNNAELALAYFTRSAKQANVDSLVKMGDYYLASGSMNGGGGSAGISQASSASASPPLITTESTTGDTNIPSKGGKQQSDLEKAATCYTTAAESHHSAQAFWNLGWMHEHGIGSVTKDYHMAKRYYDLALEMNKEAYLPVTLALTKLRVRSWWNGVSGGKVNGIRDDDDDNKKARPPKSFTEWVNRFLDAAEEMDAAEEAAARDREGGAGGDDDFMGGLAGGAEPGMPGGDSDYAARARERQANPADDGYGADEWDDFDDGLVESLIIIALAGALALLVYARQARQRAQGEEERRRRNEGQPQAPGQPANVQQGQPQPPQQQLPGAQGQAGGMFPGPGDPEFNNWVAGGIGH